LFPEDEEDPDNWEWLAEPVRKEPDPEHVEQFVNDQIAEPMRLRFRGWF